MWSKSPGEQNTDTNRLKDVQKVFVVEYKRLESFKLLYSKVSPTVQGLGCLGVAHNSQWAKCHYKWARRCSKGVFSRIRKSRTFYVVIQHFSIYGREDRAIFRAKNPKNHDFHEFFRGKINFFGGSQLPLGALYMHV